MKLKRTLVICDIDSTLADATHRLPKKKPPQVSLEKFFKRLLNPKKMIKDPVIEEIKKIVNAIYAWDYYDTSICIVTARNTVFTEVTKEWLEKNNISYDSLCMNPNENLNKDGKEENIKKLLKEFKPTIKIAIDDDFSGNTQKIYKKYGFTFLKVIR